MELIGKIAVIFFIIVLSTICTGYAGMVLWGWFVSPLFGLPNLPFTYALGLGLVFRVLTGMQDRNDDEEDAEWSEKMYRAFGSSIAPLFALGVGWVITLFM